MLQTLNHSSIHACYSHQIIWLYKHPTGINLCAYIHMLQSSNHIRSIVIKFIRLDIRAKCIKPYACTHGWQASYYTSIRTCYKYHIIRLCIRATGIKLIRRYIHAKYIKSYAYAHWLQALNDTSIRTCYRHQLIRLYIRAAFIKSLCINLEIYVGIQKPVQNCSCFYIYWTNNNHACYFRQ